MIISKKLTVKSLTVNLKQHHGRKAFRRYPAPAPPPAQPCVCSQCGAVFLVPEESEPNLFACNCVSLF